MTPCDDDDAVPRWWVLRDLKRANALQPAWRMLGDMGLDVYTPLVDRVTVSGGRKHTTAVPYIPDLVFVRATRSRLDPVVQRTPTLQYRFVKGAPYGTAMTVPARDMEMFITASRAMRRPRYIDPTQVRTGARVRIVSAGPFDGLEGRLVTTPGNRRKSILVSPSLALGLALTLPLGAADLLEILD